MAARVGIDLGDIIDAATRLADRDGVESVTLASVANEVGVQASSLYHYVDGVAGLKRKLSLRGMVRLADGILAATSGLARDDAVWAISTAIRDLSKSHPGLYAATIAPAAIDDVELTEAGDRLFQTIRSALRGYELVGDEAYHLIRGIRTAIHGFVITEMNRGFRYGAEVEETFKRVVATQIHAFNNWDDIVSLGETTRVRS